MFLRKIYYYYKYNFFSICKKIYMLNYYVQKLVVVFIFYYLFYINNLYRFLIEFKIKGINKNYKK